MKQRKLICLVLSWVMVLSLTACGANNSDAPAHSAGTAVQSAAETMDAVFPVIDETTILDDDNCTITLSNDKEGAAVTFTFTNKTDADAIFSFNLDGNTPTTVNGAQVCAATDQNMIAAAGETASYEYTFEYVDETAGKADSLDGELTMSKINGQSGDLVDVGDTVTTAPVSLTF